MKHNTRIGLFAASIAMACIGFVWIITACSDRNALSAAIAATTFVLAVFYAAKIGSEIE